MENNEIISPTILQKAFPGMRDSEAREMIDSGVIRDFPSNTVICKEGALETTFYVIVEGQVEVTKVINDDEVRLLKHLGPGDFFGEMAIIHEAPRGATVASLTPLKTLEIGKKAFERLLERSSSMSIAMVREVSRRLRENDEMAIEDFRRKAIELAKAYQQLADLETARSSFLATIAHELRTPLMSASGFLQMIQTGSLKGEGLKSALEIVGRNLQQIIALMNDILFLQEMDLILPEFSLNDIGAVVAASVENQRSYASRNNSRLKLDISPNLPEVSIDPKSMERAITAILNNAIKFSPDGGEVDIEVGSRESDLWIKVKDHGVGINVETLPRIYDRFFHVDKVGEHLFGGVGLGLSIARQVILQHNGKIEVESEIGKGSTFTIHLKANNQ